MNESDPFFEPYNEKVVCKVKMQDGGGLFIGLKEIFIAMNNLGYLYSAIQNVKIFLRKKENMYYNSKWTKSVNKHLAL